MRGLESTPCQTSFPVGGAQSVWESLDPEARDRVLRVLAGVIGRIMAASEAERR